MKRPNKGHQGQGTISSRSLVSPWRSIKLFKSDLWERIPHLGWNTYLGGTSLPINQLEGIMPETRQQFVPPAQLELAPMDVHPSFCGIRVTFPSGDFFASLYRQASTGLIAHHVLNKIHLALGLLHFQYYYLGQSGTSVKTKFSIGCQRTDRHL